MAPRKPPSFRSSLLGKLLREHREAAGFKLADAGEYIQRDQSTMSRLESGHQPIRVPDMQALLRFYGISDERIWNGLEGLSLDLTRKDWWDDYADTLNPLLVDIPWVEEHSRNIKFFDVLLPPGLLQTRDFAAATIRATSGESEAWVERALDFRMRRQAILELKTSPELAVILDESLLLRPIGGPKVMCGQLDHLLEQMDRPTIDLRVLRVARGAHPGLGGPFQIYEMPELLTEAVLSDSLTGVIYVEAKGVSRYKRAYDELRQIAESPEVSRQLIRDAAKVLR